MNAMNRGIITAVIGVLEDNSFDVEASNLKNLVYHLSSNDEIVRKRAVDKIYGLCQVRSYGDLNIRTINGWKWNGMLAELKKHVQKCYGSK